jgi:hypothetical protein
MKIGTVALITATVVALSGCASLSPDNPLYRTYFVKYSKCSSQKCKVAVWVSGGKVYTDFDELGIDLAYTDVEIEWKLSRWPWQDYEFRIDSIEFKADSEYAKQFTNPVVSDDDDKPVSKGKKFRWTDRNSDRKDYRYTIKVYKENSDVRILLDPTIKNQG